MIVTVQIQCGWSWESRCYEAKIEAIEKVSSRWDTHHWLELPVLCHWATAAGQTPTLTISVRFMSVDGCLAVVAQWQSTGSSSQWYPGFNSRQLPVFSLSSILASKHLNSFISARATTCTVCINCSTPVHMTRFPILSAGYYYIKNTNHKTTHMYSMCTQSWEAKFTKIHVVVMSSIEYS